MSKRLEETIPKRMRPICETILAIMDAFCKEHLHAEYMNALGMILLDPRWCLRSRLADNPLAWMLSVNGVIVDIRCAPREVQEEAFRRGLIPYLPSEASTN